tara:strand:- start:2061 stop:3050 length:990 start_codon:yes stop_codon:yes gene_type:complete
MLKQVADYICRWPFRIWGFGEGIALRGLLAAYRATDNSEYYQFVRDLLKSYSVGDVARSNEEHIAPGTELLLLFKESGDSELLDAAKKLAALNGSFPKNKFGARMHRPDMSGWGKQIWVDCIDVDAPFLIRLGNLTGGTKYIKQGLSEILGYTRALQIEGACDAAGLFWHGYDVDCGNNGQIWARGNGWALMGLVETLKLLPETSSSKQELIERMQGLCLALKRHQNADGLWHTVVTKPDTYLESTLAVMVAFGLREAFDSSLLDEKEFGEMESKARIATHRCIDKEGALGLVSDATPIAELKMYATRPFGIFPWGQGPLLLMLAQEAL